MAKNDTALFAPGDIRRAASLLSRLPLGHFDLAAARPMAAAAWAWPLIGALLGGLAGLVALLATWLSLPAPLSAALALASLIAMTGALHEDGLADTFDGLWGAQDRTRRLEIMKDSRVGSYGVLALVLALILRWSALTALFQAGWILAPLIATGALSRAPMALLMARLPKARKGGLAASTGQPEPQTALAGLAVASAIALLTTGPLMLAALFWISLVTLVLAGVAKAKIGGQTGDILGASQQLAEIAALASLATLVT